MNSRRRRRLPPMAGHRRVRGHYVHNPRRNPKSGGGMGIGTIALIGVGAFFLLRSGALGGVSTMFGGQPAVPGYIPIGGNAYRNTATGQIAYRQPTGQMTTAATGGTIVPSGGAAWTAPLVQAGVASIPLLGSGLASMIRGLFSGSVTGEQPIVESGAIPMPSGAMTATAPDVLSGAYQPPTIPEPGGAVAPAPSEDIWSWLTSEPAYATAPAPTDIFAAEGYGGGALDLTLAPDTSSWFAASDYYSSPEAQMYGEF